MAQQNFGAAVIVATPHLWTRGTHQNPHTQPDMADAIRAYAKASGFALADIYNEYAPGEYDGIHPGDTGHKHIADAYMKALLGQPSTPHITAQISAADLKDNGDGTVTDTKHSLMWATDANLAGGIKKLDEANAFIAAMNKDKKLGHDDWRLPTRDELLGLVDPANRPALPANHPFKNVTGWYITGAEGWCVSIATGVPYTPGKPEQVSGAVWPVRSVK
jgi:hypothetical protein